MILSIGRSSSVDTAKITSICVLGLLPPSHTIIAPVAFGFSDDELPNVGVTVLSQLMTTDALPTPDISDRDF